MKKINDFFINLSKYMVLVLFVWIAGFSIFMQAKYLYYDYPTFEKTNIYNYISILINLITIILMYILANKTKINIKIFMGIYLILGLLYIFIIQFVPASDMKYVYEIAVTNFKEHQIYINRNANNIPTVYLIQLFTIINKSPLTVRIINILQNISIAFISYKIAKIVFSENKFYFIFTLINLSAFIYLNLIYNDITYTLLSLSVIFLILKEERSKLDIGIAVVCSVIAFMLRPVFIIYFIAISMYEILNNKNIKFVIIYIISSIVLILLCNFLIELKFGKMEESYPMWSFIQMGFNEEKFGFQDGTHSSDYTYEDVIQKIKKLGFTKTINLIIKKETWMFSEGTYQAERYAFGDHSAAYETDNIFTKDLLNIEDSVLRKGLEYLMRGQYIITIIFAIVSIIINKNKKTSLLNYIIVGIFCFYIIWEIKSRYIYSLYPIFAIYATNGFSYCIEKLKDKLQKKVQTQ